MKRKIPPYKVILWDVNRDNVEYYDIMPYLVECWKEEKKRKHKIWNRDSEDNTKMPETFDEFKKFVLGESQYRFWSRCEYEIIVTGWPIQKHEEKIDAFDQIEANIDVLTKHFMEYINS